MSRKTELELMIKLLDKQLSLMAEEMFEPQAFPLGPGSAHDARILAKIDPSLYYSKSHVILARQIRFKQVI